MKILDDYLRLQNEIYDYFNYHEGWKVFPIEDSRQYYWSVGQHTGCLRFAMTEAEFTTGNGDCYEENLCHSHGASAIYPGQDYTLIVADTLYDGNIFLRIFDNRKRCD